MSKMIHQELIKMTTPANARESNGLGYHICLRPCVNTGKPVELVGV